MLDPGGGSTSGPPLERQERGQLAGWLLAELVQPLFSLRLQLQAIGGLTQEGRQRLDGAIEDLDTLIHDLRAGLFDPRRVRSARRCPGLLPRTNP
jgi:hypothetical protein